MFAASTYEEIERIERQVENIISQNTIPTMKRWRVSLVFFQNSVMIGRKTTSAT